MWHLLFKHPTFLKTLLARGDAKHQNYYLNSTWQQSVYSIPLPSVDVASRERDNKQTKKQSAVFVGCRLLRAAGNEIGPRPGLPGHGLEHLQDCQHGHVHLGARESPPG